MTKEEYEADFAQLEALFDAGDFENPLLMELVEKIEKYEREDPEMAEFWAACHAVKRDCGTTRTLFNQYGLALNDLPEIGDADEVAAVLEGRARLRFDQIEKLCARFGLSPQLFED